MQFKHPEILYALLLLIIPIIVHLFQLQRFSKVAFTNVKFLKNIVQQTRKSSRVKKLLILATRMLAFACLIIAFSQPYFSKFTTQQTIETTIYLDNSYSMQAKGAQGELLKSAAQKIIENATDLNTSITLLTNSTKFQNLDATNLKNELVTIQYSPNKVDLETVFLELNKQKSNTTNTLYKNILISDFQKINIKNKYSVTNANTSNILLKTTPTEHNNIYIDTVYIKTTTAEEILLNVVVKSVETNNLNVAVSLLNNKKLIGKTTANFTENNIATIQFSISNTTNFSGEILLADEVLPFDNHFYFTISKPAKINVLCIGENAAFLSKIYTENEFNYTNKALQNLNYNDLQNQQLIILNELEIIPIELTNNLLDFIKNIGNIVVIPTENCDLNSYNQLLNKLQIGTINSKVEEEHLITSINYNHPLISQVFEKKVENFQYPSTKFNFNTQLNNPNSVLTFDNNMPFIASINSTNNTFYWIATSLKTTFTNFTQSPLVVPIFYNFAKNSLKINDLYYTINPNTSFDIKTSLGKDEVLKMSNSNSTFIPLQKITQNKVTIDLQNVPLESGFYNLLKDNEIISTIALNYNKDESNLTYANVENIVENATILTSIDEIFEEINNQQQINWLFKWFLSFSVLFLLIEMLILKYFKI
jgi:hypothetical protein